MDICRWCSADLANPVLDFGCQPIAHDFARSRDATGEFRHRLALHLCKQCGLLQISQPVPQEVLYDNYVCLSQWKVNPHLNQLWEQVALLPGLDPATDLVVEAGCNDGGFLLGLRERGFQRLAGIEPARDVEAIARQSGLDTIRDFLCDASAESLLASRGKCRLFVSRHVLEHVQDLHSFLSSLQRILAPEAHVLIEVPNFEFNLRWLDYGGVWEQHVNYFTASSLTRLLAAYGIRVDKTETATFSGEALIVWGRFEGVTSETNDVHLAEVIRMVQRFSDSWPAFQTMLLEEVKRLRKVHGPIAVYGAGCRACSLINFTGIGELLDFAVDDQPEKQGLFLPGSRLEIRPSAALIEDGIQVCLLAVNSENEERVIQRNQSFVDRGGPFLSLHPPSSRLIEPWRAMV